MANKTDVTQAKEYLKKRMAEFTEGYLRNLDYILESRCESPIEALLYLELLLRHVFERWPDMVWTQYKIGPYRVDIAAEFKLGSKTHKVAIECDGHDYHERTEQQARHDKNKDRFLQSQGWLVARFTGKEITECPKKCAEEIFNLVLDVEFNNR